MRKAWKSVLFAALLAAVLIGTASAASADTLTLPSGLKTIEAEAFMGDTSLDEVILPEGLESIGANAFANSSVKRIYLPEKLSSIAENAFAGCNNLVGYGPDNTVASRFFDSHDGLTFERDELKPAVVAYNTDYYRISWTSLSGVEQYTVKAYLDSACTNLYISVECTDNNTGLNEEPGVRYYFIVECEKNGRIQKSGPVTADPIPTLAAPLNLTGTLDEDGTLHLTWDAVPNAQGYRVYCTSEEVWTQNTYYAFVESTSYDGYTVQSGQCLYFWVRACASGQWNPGRITAAYLVDKTDELPDNLPLITDVSFQAYIIDYLEDESAPFLSIFKTEKVVGNSNYFNFNTYISETLNIEDARKSGYGHASSSDPKMEFDHSGYFFTMYDGSGKYADTYYVWLEASNEYGTTLLGPYEIHPEYRTATIWVKLFGTVKDHYGNPISNVMVKRNEEIFTYTDENGYWEFEQWDRRGEGKILSFSRPNYVVARDSSLHLDYFSTEEELDDVVINPVYEYWDIDDSTCGLIEYNGYEASILIPSTDSSGKILTEIWSAFSYCNELTTVIIPNGVIRIGGYAFNQCSKLTSVYIPESVTAISKNAFMDCNSFTIYGKAGSYAETWANENNIPFSTDPMPGMETEPETQLNGSFTEEYVTMFLGETRQLAGKVSSSDAEIKRVTLTIDGYDVPGDESDRYAFDDFSDHHMKEVDLQYWAAFTLDTTREPLDVPGTYSIILWANTVDNDHGVMLDKLTVKVEERADIADVKYNNVTISNRNRYASAGTKRFSVEAFCSMDQITVLVDGKKESATISGTVFSISLPEGVHSISFKTEKNEICGKFAIFTSRESQMMEVKVDQAPFLYWPNGGIRKKLTIGQSVEVLGSIDDFYYVTIDHVDGFISMKLISITDSSVPPNAESEEAKKFAKEFLKPAEEFSSLLTLYSAQAMYDAYSSPDELLSELGFKTDGRASGNIPDMQTHSVGYYFARKDIIDENGDTVPLFAIIIRGSSGGFTSKEWESNFVVGNGNEHVGFNSAAVDVWSAFEYYLRNKWGLSEANDRYKLWITGHSRGAAVGNLLAGKYFAHKPTNDVYAYLFATPRTTKTPNQNSNIRNFVFDGDPVARVPLESWGFGRYGTLISFPNGSIFNGKRMATGTEMGIFEDVLEILVKDSSSAESLISDVYDLVYDFNLEIEKKDYVLYYYGETAKTLYDLEDFLIGCGINTIVDLPEASRKINLFKNLVASLIR